MTDDKRDLLRPRPIPQKALEVAGLAKEKRLQNPNSIEGLCRRVVELETNLARLSGILQIDAETGESAIVLLNPRLQAELKAEAEARREQNQVPFFTLEEVLELSGACCRKDRD